MAVEVKKPVVYILHHALEVCIKFSVVYDFCYVLTLTYIHNCVFFSNFEYVTSFLYK